jgi:putative glutamine amidotransferase
MRRPILLATAFEERAAPYIEALRAMEVPAEEIVVVTPAERSEAGSRVAGSRGLVLCGGADVEPDRYGEATLPNVNVETTPGRDELEWALLDGARAARLPVWGICRGMQVLNVYLGGSLWQDLPSQRPSSIEHSVPEPLDRLAHRVRVTAPDVPLGSRLTGQMGGNAVVNSRHHQAVKRLAPGLLPVAESEDGLIEAFILTSSGSPETSDWWVRAVQWHPENLIAHADQRALWQDFLEATR